MHFVGRLATYKYYNMDQVVAQALTLVAKLHGERRLEVTREPAAAPATDHRARDLNGSDHRYDLMRSAAGAEIRSHRAG